MTSTVNRSLTFSPICVEAVLGHFEYRHKVHIYIIIKIILKTS